MDEKLLFSLLELIARYLDLEPDEAKSEWAMRLREELSSADLSQSTKSKKIIH